MSIFWHGWATTLLYVAALIISAALCHWLTGAARQLALKRNVIDTPNGRSSHSSPTPRGGGISIVIVLSALTAVITLIDAIHQSLGMALLVSGAMVAAVGLADDYRPVSSAKRFCIHLLASAASIWILDAHITLPLPEWNWVITGAWSALLIVALVWLINLYNFMDGIDGIATIELITVLMGAAFICFGHQSSLAFVFLLLASPAVGFLFWNWAPAKIFMGDSCSGFLGLFIGTLAIWTSTTGTSEQTGLNVWSWLILLGIFLVDSSWTLVIRLLTRQKWHQPHRSHCYQILSRQLKSHAQVSTAVALINLIWLLPLSAWAAVHPELGIYFCAVAYLPLALLCALFGAGNPNK